MSGNSKQSRVRLTANLTRGNRRAFLSSVGSGLGAAAAGWWAFKNPDWPALHGKERYVTVPVLVHGPSHQIGHRLRDPGFWQKPATETVLTDVVIAGGGVAGLSAAYHLRRRGLNNFYLFDLETEVGGNARFGERSGTAFPWGAHYIPLPDANNRELCDFLQDCDVIVGWDQGGHPIFNDTYLSGEPQERLFIYGKWQDGVVPKRGTNANDQAEFERFFSLMEHWRQQRDEAGRLLFSLPVRSSGWDQAADQLDNATFKEWALAQGFTSAPLHWYLNYCTRDDFGTPYDQVSAWAGIHYFAARRSNKPGTHAGHEVLTWPEGNGFLRNRLLKPVSDAVVANSLVLRVGTLGLGQVFADVWHASSDRVIRYQAKAVVVATPHHVAKRMVQDPVSVTWLGQLEPVSHAPWLVAQLHLKHAKQHFSEGMAWDNVLYRSQSLGYVLANHQQINVYEQPATLTYYRPLDELDPVSMRRSMLERPASSWWEEIKRDLEQAHPNLSASVSDVELMLWAHAMVRPLPGVARRMAKARQTSPSNRLIFAHTDYSGFSVFEEAFDQGAQASEKVWRWLYG